VDDFEKDLEKQIAAQVKTVKKKVAKKKVVKKTKTVFTAKKHKVNKDGSTPRRRGPKPKAKVPDQILPAEIVQAGKSGREKSLTPKERESIRTQLVQFFGTSKVDKRLMGCLKASELSSRLCKLRDEMEQDIEQMEQDNSQYFAQIDNEYKKIGRPNAPFTWRELDYLCSMACAINEIAGFFDLHPDTLRSKVKKEYGITFSEYYDRRSQGIKIAIRRSQINSAIGGDTNMLKFLGINLLGQKNKIEFEGKVQVNTFADLVKNLDNKARGVNNGETDQISKDEEKKTD